MAEKVAGKAKGASTIEELNRMRRRPLGKHGLSEEAKQERAQSIGHIGSLAKFVRPYKKEVVRKMKRAPLRKIKR